MSLENATPLPEAMPKSVSHILDFFFFEVLISHLLRSSLSVLVNERELLGNIPLVKKSITKIQYKKAYIELGA